jgi:hypothetical protein
LRTLKPKACLKVMRSCPTCQRTYPDDNQTNCPYDGAQLSQPFYAPPPPYQQQQQYGAPQQPPPGAYPMPPQQAYGAPPPAGGWQGGGAYPPPAYAGAVGASGYRACPKCQRPDPDKVGFTWWGGVIGPRMLSHVKCRGCGTQYNGKTGQSNTTAIVIYSVVLFVIGLVIVLVAISR